MKSEARMARSWTVLLGVITFLTISTPILDGMVDMGADEVACTNIYHPLDWNADGVVNMNEFYDFSAAWLSQPTDPEWIAHCDLDHDYDVDLADLIIFADYRNANWLWVACWRKDLQPEQLGMMMRMALGSGLLTQSLSVSSAVTTTAITAEKPIREQIIELKDTVQFLERLWLTDDSIQQEIDTGEWREFMEKVYQSMGDLQMSESETSELKEVQQ
jgi:hypothetical protein